MRWNIVETKRKIATEDFEGHRDDIEMSGEQVSAIVSYAVRDGVLTVGRELIYPMVRIQPNNTHGSYAVRLDENPLDLEAEQFDRVELDGVLTLFSHTERFRIVRRMFPSTELPAFYEQIELTNCGSDAYSLSVPACRRLDLRMACRGYAVAECHCEAAPESVAVGECVTLTFAYTVRHCNETIPIETDPLAKRRARVLQLLEECDLTTGNDCLDTAFAFAKIRAGESLYRTRGGLVHSPGGGRYYAAVWCNDQCEYVTPWFAFTGDEKQREATENTFAWYEPFMNDEYRYLPSSIIAEGNDFWAGARDRGDAAMYAFGLSRFLLTRGELPQPHQEKALDWCVEYTLRQMTEEDVIRSDYDELEGRLSSGINLATSSLAYGAFQNLAVLYKRMHRDADAQKMLDVSEKLHAGMMRYFGSEVSGYQTYQYHQGCQEIRAWNCLPAYMGILDRAKETADAIDERLWHEGSCRTTEGEKIVWDRSALYFMMSLFRMGDSERAYERLNEYTSRRLLGDRVPYAVEAYPENNMRHLSAESALLCRVVTDGLLNIGFDEQGAMLNPMLPGDLRRVEMKRIYLDGKYRDLLIQNGTITLSDSAGE